jgi:hypothetical protein
VVVAIPHKDKPLAGAGEGKKCAPSDINSPDMLTEELKEKRQKQLRLVQDEVDHIIKNYPMFLPDVGNFVAKALVLLQSEKHQEAWSALWTAYQCLLPALDVNGLYRFAPEPILEKVKNELIVLNLGIFAYRLEGSFLQLHEVVPYLWDKRKNLYPHLASALRATYWFLCLIEEGRELEEALHIAMRVRNELHDAFGDVFYCHEKNISRLLSPDALATLRQILLDIYSKRQGGKR